MTTTRTTIQRGLAALYTNGVRDHGYAVHEALADRLGKPRYLSGYNARIEVILADGTRATLVSTTNSGFRGIEGTFEVVNPENPIEPIRITTNLGFVVEGI